MRHISLSFFLLLIFSYANLCGQSIGTPNESRIFFIRIYRPGQDFSRLVKIGDSMEFELQNGSYKVISTSLKSIKFKCGLVHSGIDKLDLLPGKDYYIVFYIENKTSVKAMEANEDDGKMVFEHEKVDREARQLLTQQFKKKEFVSDYVEPIPFADPEYSNIYLFRGANFMWNLVPCHLLVDDSLFVFNNRSSHSYRTNSDSLIIRTLDKSFNKVIKLPLQKGMDYYFYIGLHGSSIKEVSIDLTKALLKLPELKEEQKVVDVKHKEKPELSIFNKRNVYIYRPAHDDLEESPLEIYTGDSIFTFRNNSSHITYLPEGNSDIISFSNFVNFEDTSLDLNIERGKTYFIRVAFRDWKYEIKEVSEKEAKSGK